MTRASRGDRSEGGTPEDDQLLAELVAAGKLGDRDAQDELVRRLLPGLRRHVRSLVGARLRGREEWSDLVQAACVELMRQLPQLEYRGDRALRGWLLHAARRKVLERVRYWSRTKRGGAAVEQRRDDATGSGDDDALQEAFASDVTPTRAAIAREELLRVYAAFATMPEDQRRAIVLHRLMGLSHQEIAVRLARREGAVRQLLFRALARLHEVLAAPPASLLAAPSADPPTAKPRRDRRQS